MRSRPENRDRLYAATDIMHCEHGLDAAEIVNELFDAIQAEIRRRLDLDIEQHAHEMNGAD